MQGRTFFFFFFLGAVFDILLRLLRDAPKPSHHLHPDRARVLSQVLPADGALSRGWSPVTPPPLKKKPQLLRSSGVVNKKTGARMLAVAEVTVSSFECDLRGPAGCRSELECVGERNCQLKMWSFVNSHVAFVGVCVHVRDDKFPYHRVNLSQA